MRWGLLPTKKLREVAWKRLYIEVFFLVYDGKFSLLALISSLDVKVGAD